MLDGDRNRAAISVLSVASRGRSSSSKLSAARMPVQCTGSPTVACSSHSTVSSPARASRSATNRPPGPPPTTSASIARCGELWGMSRCHYKGGTSKLHASIARFPLAAPGDPERQHDQFEIQPETGAPQVQTIEAELAGARNVARRVHLCEARESGTDLVALDVAWDFVERYEPPVATRFDFARTQRPRTD